MNEWILILSLVITYGMTLLFYRLFGKSGLYCWTALATIAANIEVLIVIVAFGMEQTLGNILFASTFLVTDILSEIYGKDASKKAVGIGIATSLSFIVISQSWLIYTPAASDFAMPHMQAIFSNTPRLMFTSFLVYAICQRFDVWAYHKWWAFTTKKCGDSTRFLWLRNNGSTLVSQFLNTLLFTFGAFAGIYDFSTLLSIVWSSYIIFIVTSLADTPVVYLARKIKPPAKGSDTARQGGI
ncbi:queuosine precursor transporter [Lachnospiraceae bacterium 47-T17]